VVTPLWLWLWLWLLMSALASPMPPQGKADNQQCGGGDGERLFMNGLSMDETITPLGMETRQSA